MMMGNGGEKVVVGGLIRVVELYGWGTTRNVADLEGKR
jgi:hypothetical protein